MAGDPRFVQLRRVPPGVWAASAWAVTTVYALWTAQAALYVPPRPPVPLWVEPAGQPGYRVVLLDAHPYVYAGAAVLVLIGSALLGRMPRTALGLLLVGSATSSIVLHTAMVMILEFFPANIALWSLADRELRRRSLTALAMAAVVWTAYMVLLRMLTDSGTLGPPPAAGVRQDFSAMDAVIVLSGLVFWLAGVSGRQARAHNLSAAAESAAAERLRLSRDLHDSVAHDIGIIAVLAGAAVRVLDTRPEAAREALAGIETTSRDTLTGLQQMLRTLRNADVRADPGVLDVERLAARATGAGVRVELSWSGERRTLPPEIDRSVYRIIQEAVTNVVRHSGTTACRVAVGFEPDAVAIEITDDGCGVAPGLVPGMAPGVGSGVGSGVAPGTAADAGPSGADPDAATAGTLVGTGFGADCGTGQLGSRGGFGLLGMRERVTMLSGQFSAGPRPEGGFRVAARLPA
ncbi:hypothetical protein GCM10009839_22880 [Catenulispora yoronensis]|uniref:histidine kinase n=1 Tax=Catenulispora yoronensis TaxID=450799 RepID=A0ABN2TZM8_9ACTN